MAAGKWKVYNSAKEYIGDGTVDLDSHNFKIALFSSSSNANDLAQSTLGALTNQLSTANGYTSSGQTLANVIWNRLGGTMTFDADNVEWTATGGSLVAKYAVIYDDTAANDELVAVCQLDTSTDVTATVGSKLQIIFDAAGIFTISGATTE